MSLRRPASPNGFKMREKSQLVPLGAWVGNVGSGGLGSEPTVTGTNQYFCVPTGQWVIRKRGGDLAPCALASMLRRKILSPTAPAPTLRMKERRAMRYGVIAFLQRSGRRV